MSKFTNAALAAAFGASMLAAPVAMAQTSPQAQSTGGVEHIKDQKDADKTRMQGGSAGSSSVTAEPQPTGDKRENSREGNASGVKEAPVQGTSTRN